MAEPSNSKSAQSNGDHNLYITTIHMTLIVINKKGVCIIHEGSRD